MRFAPALFAAVLFLGLSRLEAGDGPCSSELLDFDWRFITGDVPGAEAPGFDDQAWRAVDLPHDFAIEGPFDPKAAGGFPNGFRPLGVGWYRKSFPTPLGLAGKRITLDFEGVYRAPKVWVNGVLVAERLNGYTGFRCDITPHLKPAGQDNLVAVRADNSLPDTSRWYTGGGIYRHVHLIITGEVHVVPHGIAITTPAISPAAVTVQAATEVINDSQGLRWTTVASRILSPDGRAVAEASAVVPIRAGETFTVRQRFVVGEPRLWSLTDAALYRLESRVSVAGDDQDLQRTAFGIRDMLITTDGFFLNGKREFLKGFCVHHDQGCLGAAAFDRAIERRLLTMKELGCNAIRLAHNPHAPAVLDLCDRLGILVYDEAFDIRNGQFYGSNEAFKQHWAEDLRWFVRRDRNHPSVFIWSIGNEGKDIFQAPDYGVDQSAAMADLVRQLEPTRPVTQALYPMRWDAHRNRTADRFPDWENDPPHQVAFHMDVMSANYMEKFYARDRVRFPQLAYISSESNTGANGRTAWAALDRQHAVGIFYWGGIPYIGESHKWPIKSWTAGYLDLAGFRRPGSWDVQSFFSDKPMVHLVIDRPESTRIWNDVKISHSNLLDHWTFTPGMALKVEAYSNAQEVELLLNGTSLGIRQRADEPGIGARLVWDVPFAAGTITAIARTAGAEVARHELRTAGAATALRLIPDRTVLDADGQDLAHVRVEVVDAQGVVQPEAAQAITFTVAGAGTNAGVDNGDPASDECFQGATRRAYQGVALLVVRAKRQPGTIAITATATGLALAEIRLTAR